jgi:TetR/AcrR family transcriptional regulator
MKAEQDKKIIKDTPTMESGAGTRSRMKSGDRRAQIVEVARSLFSKKGFRGTTTREIAEEAAISEATIFKHFKCKKDLYAAIIEMCCNDPEGDFVLTKQIQGKHGREAFLSIAECLISRYEEDATFGRLLMFGALEGTEFSDLFLRSKGVELLEFLSSEISTLTKEGVFIERDPEVSARAFLGMVVHYGMTQEIYGFKRFFKRPSSEVAACFVDIFFDGMKRKEGNI